MTYYFQRDSEVYIHWILSHETTGGNGSEATQLTKQVNMADVVHLDFILHTLTLYSRKVQSSSNIITLNLHLII